MYTGCAGYSAFPVFLRRFGVDPVEKRRRKIPQIKIEIEWRLNTSVPAFLTIRALSVDLEIFEEARDLLQTGREIRR